MKKVARLRIPAAEDDINSITFMEPACQTGVESVSVRTTGRIKKPKAVFDPSDNYLPRAQRTFSVCSFPSSSSNSMTSMNPLHNLAQRKRDSSVLVESFQRNRFSMLPTTNSPPPAASTSCAFIEPGEDVCEVCKKREAKRGAHARNKLVPCVKCKKCVHKLCIKMEFEDFEELRRLYKCDDCRECDICGSRGNGDFKNNDLITCTKCVKSYHFNCHKPPLSFGKYPFQNMQHNWKCHHCCASFGIRNGKTLADKTIFEIIGDERTRSRLTPAPAQQHSEEEQKPKPCLNLAPKRSDTEILSLANGTAKKFGTTRLIIENTDQKEIINKSGTQFPNYGYNDLESIELPDVKNWTVEQVTEFMSKYFPKESHVFMDHEIDGASLLLLKRSDVVKKLSIKLGPSLRIYSLILKIQAQLNDPTLGWNCSL